MKIFENLNEAQIAAASHIDGAMLILAGAGSGKTKTITSRLAYLIDELGIDPSATLTLTFTNKAAAVMRQRALAMIKNNYTSLPLLCTFHKFGLLFLRFYIEKLSRKSDFIVIDTDDGKKILKDILEDKSSASSVLNFISTCKNSFQSVDDVYKSLELVQGAKKDKLALYAKAYKYYNEALLANNFCDFDDLLLLTHQILSEDKELATKISKQYAYIMVDEYQDTNDLQHKILRLLCTSHENLVVVGDDDQSIYAWRGAKIENILSFQDEFKEVKLVRLEQNYRSTEAILEAANTLIKNNNQRLGKSLIATKDGGEALELWQNADEKEEGLKLALSIKKDLQNGTMPSEIAILYRVNALSRSVEEALMREKIPFKILSGVRFYERSEVKTAINYLRFINNTDDDFSLRQILNTPKRGFGNSSLEKLNNLAKTHNTSLFTALCLGLENEIFSKKISQELEPFMQNIQELHQMKENGDLNELLNGVLNNFNLKEYFSDLPQGDERVRNLDELFANLKDTAQSENISDLSALLSYLSLQSDQDNMNGDVVYLMSIHASKGLEFDNVYVVGLEEGFFPLQNEESNIEEERRLAYVAITRAKKKLVLSSASSRFFRGSRSTLQGSRFLNELQGSSFDEVPLNKEFAKGDLIKHKIFGIGRVVNVRKSGEIQSLEINFGGIIRSNIQSPFVQRI